MREVTALLEGPLQGDSEDEEVMSQNDPHWFGRNMDWGPRRGKDPASKRHVSYAVAEVCLI